MIRRVLPHLCGERLDTVHACVAGHESVELPAQKNSTVTAMIMHDSDTYGLRRVPMTEAL
eukprot:2797646-Prymnesium_polylepis.2